MQWKDGYVIDTGYTYNYWDICAPTRLALAAVLNGWKPPSLERFRVLELGCGHGLQSALLAAANPQAEVVGVDFNPEHIATAEGMKNAASIRNATFICASFTDLANDPPAGLGTFDFILLHGVYTWINEKARQDLLHLLGRVARPGALIYISYNALPGCSAMRDLQAFLVNFALRNPGRSDQQALDGFAFAKRIHAVPSSSFRWPGVTNRVDRPNPGNPHYLAHEYLHQDWKAFYFLEIEKVMAEQGFLFAGRCDTDAAFPEMTLAPEVLATLPEGADVGWRETLLDYMVPVTLRTDIFHAQAPRLSPADREAHLEEMRFAAVRVSDTWPGPLTSKSGRQVLPEPVVADLRALFERGPATGRAMKDVLAGHGSSAQLDVVIALMVAGKYVAPAQAQEVDPEPARRFNRMVVSERPFASRFAYFASPVLGNGMQAWHATALALETQHIDGLEARVAAAEALLAERGEVLLHGGVRLTDPVAQRAELAKWFVEFGTRSWVGAETLKIAI